ncbi:hypothetical protein [Nonomuraea gerenzanensis]|uniref:Pericardin n=1 Tax=Nonomuraea gerenzanensis TaxID=93944 RepID=A0A1M4EGU8_9ACTN|nr:hypothetical protein [Nonomuraea gerenzanensis]UBU09381.1 hypothetical protein LCN96_34075 [Nonomuraea gerenzanensis]SBO97793.1 pericardin [Nonomuraea gerenzanensis]
MTYPSQPQPDDPWGQQAPQGYGHPGHGPQPRQGGPPPDHGHRPDYGPGPYHHQEAGPAPPPNLQTTTYANHPYEFGGLPPRRHNTLIIGLSAALGVMLLLGGTAGAVAYFSASRAQPATSLSDTDPTRTLAEPTRSQEPAPSQEPTSPADEPAGTTPGTSQAAPGSPITHDEFDDWRFRFEDVKFSANKVGGWSYDTCDPVDGQGVLARNNCERAIQVAYSAYRGHLRAVQVTMAFPTDKAAKAAATRLAKLDSDAVNIRSDMTLDTFAYGQIRANVAKKYVIATIVTADRTARPRAEKFHLYLQADAMSYFLLRDVTITS